MDVYKTIISKRDTRSYSDQPISDESLHRILQAGRMAGSAKNVQPCRFVVVRSAEKKRELAGCGQFAQHVPNAAVAVAVVHAERRARVRRRAGGAEHDAGRLVGRDCLLRGDDA